MSSVLCCMAALGAHMNELRRVSNEWIFASRAASQPLLDEYHACLQRRVELTLNFTHRSIVECVLGELCRLASNDCRSPIAIAGVDNNRFISKWKRWNPHQEAYQDVNETRRVFVDEATHDLIISKALVHDQGNYAEVAYDGRLIVGERLLLPLVNRSSYAPVYEESNEKMLHDDDARLLWSHANDRQPLVVDGRSVETFTHWSEWGPCQKPPEESEELDETATREPNAGYRTRIGACHVQLNSTSSSQLASLMDYFNTRSLPCSVLDLLSTNASTWRVAAATRQQRHRLLMYGECRLKAAKTNFKNHHQQQQPNGKAIFKESALGIDLLHSTVHDVGEALILPSCAHDEESRGIEWKMKLDSNSTEFSVDRMTNKTWFVDKHNRLIVRRLTAADSGEYKCERVAAKVKVVHIVKVAWRWLPLSLSHVEWLRLVGQHSIFLALAVIVGLSYRHGDRHYQHNQATTTTTTTTTSARRQRKMQRERKTKNKRMVDRCSLY